jgi:replicative DNA helicase
MSEQLFPRDLTAERGVLGCCLLTPALSLSDVLAKLGNNEPQDAFYDTHHREIFRAMFELYRDGTGIDILTLTSLLEKQKPDQPWASLMASLEDEVGSSANLEFYLKPVMECWFLRKLIEVSRQHVELAKNPENHGGVGAVLDRAETDILELNSARAPDQGVDLGGMVDQLYEEIENYERGEGRLTGLDTGFEYLNKQTSGFQKRQMILIAGRPGMGKTSFATNIVADLLFRQNVPVAFFSMEMAAVELVERIIFAEGWCNYQNYRTGFAYKADLSVLLPICEKFRKVPLYLDDTTQQSILDIRAKCRRLKAQHGIKLVVLDYVQLIRGTSSQYNNRESEIAEISRGIKALAKELEIPVLGLAQLNRASAQKGHYTPSMEDLRESGQLEQDADLVAILADAQPRNNEERDMWESGEGWLGKKRRNLVIVKQRNGPCGKSDYIFHKAEMRFAPYKEEKTTYI